MRNRNYCNCSYYCNCYCNCYCNFNCIYFSGVKCDTTGVYYECLKF